MGALPQTTPGPATRRENRRLVAAGALLAFLAVGAGALGAHALRTRLDPSHLALYRTAVEYQTTHALALLLLGLLDGQAGATGRWYARAGWCIAAGVVLFCGSLYALAFGAPAGIGATTPFGGLLLLGGWLLCLVGAWRRG